jgi:hypothetical protein
MLRDKLGVELGRAEVQEALLAVPVRNPQLPVSNQEVNHGQGDGPQPDSVEVVSLAMERNYTQDLKTFCDSRKLKDPKFTVAYKKYL